MPLRATEGSHDLLAFAIPERDWDDLKRSHTTRAILMPCCGTRAIPKTSKLGLQFFAHSTNDCNFKPESPEHEYVKFLVARTAHEAGWTVKTECRDETPLGDVWVADVFCSKGNAKIALEIQLSSQTVTETKCRQKRYRASNVRCAWFMAESVTKNSLYHPSRELPIFMVSKPIVGKIPEVQDFGVKLDEFVKELLSGGVKWKEQPCVYSMKYITDICWKCHTPNKQVVGYAINVYDNCFKTVPHASTVLEETAEIITNEELKALGLNTVGKFDMRRGIRISYPYCNVCIHCQAPQFNPHVMKKLDAITFGKGKGEIEFIEFVSPREAEGYWGLA